MTKKFISKKFGKCTTSYTPLYLLILRDLKGSLRTAVVLCFKHHLWHWESSVVSGLVARKSCCVDMWFVVQ